MNALPLLPDLTGHLDGHALRWGGEVVQAYPTMAAACVGRQTAQEALAMLAATLAKPQQGAR